MNDVFDNKEIVRGFLDDLSRLLELHSRGPVGLEFAGGLVVVNKLTGESRILPTVFIARGPNPAEDAEYTRAIFAGVVEALSQSDYSFKLATPHKPE